MKDYISPSQRTHLGWVNTIIIVEIGLLGMALVGLIYLMVT